MLSIKKISEQTGVSTATVSRALDPRLAHLVKEGTRRKIQEFCRRHNYTPNFSAQSLRRGSMRTVGIIMPRASGHYGELMLHLDRLLVQHGYSALFAFWDRISKESYTSAFDRLIARNVDGIITVQHDWTPADSGVEVVIFGNSCDDFECVYPDKYAFGCEVINYLYCCGIRRIGAIGNLTDVRYHGMRDAMAGLGLEYRDNWFADWYADDCINSFFRQTERPEAVITHSDLTACKVYYGAARAGVSIPDELSVISFDNLPESAEMYPALSTYDQKLAAAAELLVSALLERIADPGLPLRCHSYPVELKERESVKFIKQEICR